MEKPKRIKCCKVSLNFLRIARILPGVGMENSRQYLAAIAAIFSLVALVTVLVISYVFVGLNNHFPMVFIQFPIVCLVSICGVMWINGFCVKNRHLLLQLEEALSDCSSFGKPPAYEIFAQKMNFLSKLHLAYVTGGALLYFIFFAPMHKNNCEAFNIQRNFSEICALLIPIYIPLVPDAALEKFPLLQLIDAAEFLMLMYIYVVCGTVVWLNVEVIEYICLRIRHLRTVLLDALTSPNRATRRGLFGRAVQYHEEILRMGRLADEFFGTELALHVVLTGAILGVSAFVMLESATLETLMIFVGWLNAIIMGCAAGQRLINESVAISGVLYEVDWFDFENGLKKDLLFFLVRSRKPMYIRAGNVIMANELIIQILRTSYSYVTFLSSIDGN